MVSPSVTSSAATAVTRWNDVKGRLSQAPNRVRGAVSTVLVDVTPLPE